MEPAKSFRDLIVWHKAHELVLKVYAYTKNFPREETFGLKSQMRRAAVSVAANIAEGFAKQTLREKIKFMNIAQGSLEETRYYFILSLDLNYGRNEELQLLATTISKLLNSYINSMREKIS